MTSRSSIAPLLIVLASLSFVPAPCIGTGKVVIVEPAQADPPERLAAREIRRYLYLRTDALVPIVGGNAELSADADQIIVATPRPMEGGLVKSLIPPGMRKVIEAGELARQKGLAIVAGTQRRHQAKYRQNAHAVTQGAIGRITGGRVWWCGGGSSNPPRRESGWSDAEYLVRNWYRFSMMSGDHIVEQHCHNLDVANWFIGRPPVQALGFGGRARRQGGNQYDFFSVDLDYGDDVIVHSMCRQVKGCFTRVSEQFVGTEG
ncbi:MAG TPA: hypothetical protein VLI39_01340, partial [Sedimentisphaerales bacterium]|nr:hypothetical protein [Sedimentisphaerales bacterium]